MICLGLQVPLINDSMKTKKLTKRDKIRKLNKSDVYSELLKHPRWQKKRLKIFERDRWRCTSCGATTKMLNVHHLKYTKRTPWLEPNNNLITLCEFCHKKKHGKK